MKDDDLMTELGVFHHPCRLHHKSIHTEVYCIEVLKQQYHPKPNGPTRCYREWNGMQMTLKKFQSLRRLNGRN
jgi:hypothetical protein